MWGLPTGRFWLCQVLNEKNNTEREKPFSNVYLSHRQTSSSSLVFDPFFPGSDGLVGCVLWLPTTKWNEWNQWEKTGHDTITDGRTVALFDISHTTRFRVSSLSPINTILILFQFSLMVINSRRLSPVDCVSPPSCWPIFERRFKSFKLWAAWRWPREFIDQQQQ